MTGLPSSLAARCASICCSVGLVILIAGCNRSSSQPVDVRPVSQPAELARLSVKVAAVEVQPLATRAEFTGNLLPRRRTLIVAEVAGIVQSIADIGPSIDVKVDGKHYSEKLGILPGQEVHSGDVLVQLDRTSFELEVAAAQSKLAKAQADLAALQAWDRPETVDRLKALLAEAEARETMALAEHRRATTLIEDSAVTQTEFEQATMQLATSQAAVASARATLRQAQAGPTAEEIAVQQALVQQAEVELRQQERLLSKTTIYAPYDGVITEVHVEQGEHVSTASGPLFELLDVRYLVAEVGVSESYLGKIQLQDRAEVSLSGAVEPVPGLVVGMNDKVDPESRSFRVRIAIDNADRRFKAGQFVHVALSLAGASPTIVVPNAAITLQEGQPGVFVFDDDVVRWRVVELGMANESNTQVLSGLTSGEQIVIDNPSLLSDGMQVSTHEAR